MTSRYRIIQADQITLPRGSGDRDVEIDFEAPMLTSTSQESPANRPFISYRINLQGRDPARLVLRLNGDEIVDQTLTDSSARCFHQVIGHGALRTENTLVIRVPDDQPGTLVISDVLVVYTEWGDQGSGGGGGGEL